MKFHYDKETDSLYVDLIDRPGADSKEVAPGVILDFDENNQIVGIDIQHASKVVDLSKIDTGLLPLTVP